MKKMILFILTIAMTLSSLAQDIRLRKVPTGQKIKIKGIVISRDQDRLIVRDANGIDTAVVVTSSTNIKTKGRFFREGERVLMSELVRGLSLEVEGIGDGQNLIANKIRFDKDDLEVARTVDSRVTPTEERLSQVEQSAEKLSGQIDELIAISNAARGEVKAAQETADAAVEGVNATNARITAIDDYVVHSTATIYFKVGSAELLPEAKATLDKIAQTAMTLRGYIIEVTGFASADGDERKNKILSQKRAQAVIDYFVQTHNVPLRRIGQSYGFGELNPISDNSTPEGRAQNRRVEVKLLVSRGLNQNVEVRTTPRNQ